MEELRPKFYLLRWRFDYAGRPPSLGMWLNPGAIEQNGAWRQVREGLVRASIESKDFYSREIATQAECPGADFVNFEWATLASLDPIGLRGAVTPRTRLVGLSLVDRKDITTLYVDGTFERKARPKGHLETAFAAFGK